MTPHRLSRIGNLACACLLMLAGVSGAGAQFLPDPGQSAPSGGFSPVGGAQDPVFPPPPGQRSAPAVQDSAFPPPPGQRNQSSVFPPPPGQQRSAAQDSGFPPPSGSSQSAGGFGSPAGGGFGPPQGGGFGPQGGPTGPQAVCNNFLPIRKEAEEGALKIRAAGERKAPREEVCALFTKFTGVEAKLIKFLVDHKTMCGIPPQAIASAQSNHAKTMMIRKNVCSGGGPAPGPTLSDALGGPIIADDKSAKQPGTGTFNTLTGNVLSR